MSRCPECGRHEDMADELRSLIATARRRTRATAYGQACASMVPYYERALAALEEGGANWRAHLHAMHAAPPSARPASEPPSATSPLGAGAPAKSDVAADSAVEGTNKPATNSAAKGDRP